MAMEKFHFEHDGTEYAIPFVNGLKNGVKIKLMDALDIVETRPHELLKAFKEVCGPEAAAAIDDMFAEETSALFNEWISKTPGLPGK